VKASVIAPQTPFGRTPAGRTVAVGLQE